MNEYDYGYVEEKKKTFVDEDQRSFWEAFSKGTKEGEKRDFFTGNIQVMSAYMSMERERENKNTRER